MDNTTINDLYAVILANPYPGKQHLPDAIDANGGFVWVNNDPDDEGGMCSDHGEQLCVGCRACDPDDYDDADIWVWWRDTPGLRAA